MEAKSDHTVPEEFFHDMLDEQFSEEETLRQMETAIGWGRYAELFDFDAARRRFIAAEMLHWTMKRLPREIDAMSERSRAGTHAGASRWLVRRCCGGPGRSFWIWRCGVAGWRFSTRLCGSGGTGWAEPPSGVVVIAEHQRALPLYAFYSVVRIGLAYLLSLVFAIGYGYMAAYNTRVEAVDDRGAGHSAVDSGAELSAAGDAGDGGAGSRRGSWASRWERSC